MSGCMALLLANHEPSRISKWLVCQYRQTFMPDINNNNSSDIFPDLTPDWAGSQLLRAWYWVRDRALFNPWNEHSEQAMKSSVGSLAPAATPEPALVQQRMLDLLASDKAARALRSDLLNGPASELSHLLPNQQMNDLPDNPTDWDERLRHWLK